VSPAGNPVDDGRAAVDSGRPHEALPILEQATRSRPDDAEAWNQLGRALNNLRRHPEARQAFETAAGLAPDSADILTNLGHVCRATGDLSEAARVLREATRLAPDHRRALSCLASVLVTSGETEEGLSLVRAAARAAVDDPWPSVQLGDALQGLGNLEEAESAYRHALKVSPGLSAAQAGLGAALDALGRYEEAESWLRRALESSPGDTAAIGSLCHVLELAGRPREVLSLIDAGPWDSAPPWVVATAARQHLRLGQPDLAEQWLTRSDPDAMDRRSRAAVLNVKAALLDSRGDYPGAFEAFTAANQTLPSGFDESGYPASVNRLMRFFSRDQMRVLPDSGCDSDRPVFIVGMPRSGTSLVEQILGSHSQVLACGERRDFYRLPRRLSQGMPGAHWPECLAETSREQLAAAADAYIETAGPVGDRRITDKLPANFLNLGLVQLIFPRPASSIVAGTRWTPACPVTSRISRAPAWILPADLTTSACISRVAAGSWSIGNLRWSCRSTRWTTRPWCRHPSHRSGSWSNSWVSTGRTHVCSFIATRGSCARRAAARSGSRSTRPAWVAGAVTRISFSLSGLLWKPAGLTESFPKPAEGGQPADAICPGQAFFDLLAILLPG